jgi:hypothetical protein
MLLIFLQATRMVGAPKGFVDWAKEWEPSLSQHFSEDRKFKGRVVTSFLLDEARGDLFQLLTDVSYKFFNPPTLFVILVPNT